MDLFDLLEVGPSVAERIAALAAIVPLSMESGPWVAGGAARAWLKQSDADDIDLFFASEEQADRAEAALLAAGGVVTDRSAPYPPSAPPDGDDSADPVVLRSVYYVVPGAGIVNVARTHSYSSPAALIGSFDFTVCQVVTDGVVTVAGPRYDIDCATFSLVPLRETTRYRVCKYLGKGYRLPPPFSKAWNETEEGPIPGLVAPDGMGTVARAGQA